MDVSESDLDDHIGLWLGIEVQYATRVGHVQGLCDIFHLALDQLETASMADPRSATEVGADTCRLSEVKDAVQPWGPTAQGKNIVSGLLVPHSGKNKEDIHSHYELSPLSS